MSYRTELQLGLLFGLTLALAVVLARRSPRPAPQDFDPSTFSSGPAGSKAVYDVAAGLGYPVERRRTPLFDLTGDPRRRPQVLVVLGPTREPLQSAELEEVVRFLESGGTLVASGNAGGLTPCLGWESKLNLRREEVESLSVAPPAPGLHLPRVQRYLARHEAAPEDTTAEWRAITELRKEGACGSLTPYTVDTVARAVYLRRPVVVVLRYLGGGRAVLTGDPEYFRNRAWRASDLPVVLAPLLLPPRPPRGRISWDEYHHGHGSEASLSLAVLQWLARAPGGWAMLQLLAVAVVALAVGAVRFGPALAVIERRRRSPLEHLEALAAGLEGAAGVETALGLIVGGLRRRLSRGGLGAPPHGEPGQWLAALELASPTPQSRGAVRRLQQLITHPGGAERVLAAAQAVEDVWQDLRPRSTRGAS